MIVKDLIKRIKKMPETKEVNFFKHQNERIDRIDEGVRNKGNQKGKSETHVNWVEIAGRMM